MHLHRGEAQVTPAVEVTGLDRHDDGSIGLAPRVRVFAVRRDGAFTGGGVLCRFPGKVAGAVSEDGRRGSVRAIRGAGNPFAAR